MRWMLPSGAGPAIASGAVFVGVFLVEDALRPSYDPASMFVSELSLGTFGWIQRASFVVTGVLLLWFVRVVDLGQRTSSRSRGLRIVVGVMGSCLALSAVFDTDPSSMFEQRTTAGVVHGLLGAVVFLGMPVSCALVAGDAASARPLFRRASRVTVGLLVAGIVMLKVSEVSGPPLRDVVGLVQRAVLIVWFAWLTAYAVLHPEMPERPRVADAGDH